jgi:hypothetical protein
MKTDRLTASELATATTAHRYNPLQAATLDARIRTGRRYGVSVAKGRYIIDAVSYALNAKGNTTGAADVETLASFLVSDVDHVIAYLDAIA